MKTTLRTTTAVLACLNLAVPYPALSQNAVVETLTECENPESQECLDAAKEALTDQLTGETGAEEAAEPDAQGEAEAQGEAKQQTGADAQAQATEQPADGERSEAAAEAEADAEAQTEAEAQVDAGNRDDAGQQADKNAQAQGDQQPEAAEQGEAPAEADTDAGESVADSVREGLEEATGLDLGGDAEADADPQADAAQADAEADAKADANTEGGPDTRTGAEAEAMEGDAPEAAAVTENGEVADVTSETVTEETARSSSEDFATEIARDKAASAESDDADGLSTLEKALAVGAGALAVGALLGNREVVASSDDRVVVRGGDGEYELLKDKTALLRRPGSEVQTETFEDGSARTTVTRPDGSQIVTVRSADLRVLRRVKITPDGERIVLIDDTDDVEPVDRAALQESEVTRTTLDAGDDDALRRALAAEGAFERSYSLAQVRNIAEVRRQMPVIDLDNITFRTASAAITPSQAEELTDLGQLIRDRIDENPRELFLVEGHTDAVGDPAYNLALSDRRAESVALALTEYFDVPPENLVVQGYGERFLRIETQQAERLNRRASVRRITPLLRTVAAN